MSAQIIMFEPRPRVVSDNDVANDNSAKIIPFVIRHPCGICGSMSDYFVGYFDMLGCFHREWLCDKAPWCCF